METNFSNARKHRQDIMLEIAIGIEVEAYQYGDDFCVRHHAFATSFRRHGSRRKAVFYHLGIKFFTKIIGYTENLGHLQNPV